MTRDPFESDAPAPTQLTEYHAIFQKSEMTFKAGDDEAALKEADAWRKGCVVVNTRTGKILPRVSAA